jgi:hypothetical protein
MHTEQSVFLLLVRGDRAHLHQSIWCMSWTGRGTNDQKSEVTDTADIISKYLPSGVGCTKPCGANQVTDLRAFT